MKKFFLYLSALLAGFVNGLLGAGSGNIVVPALENLKIKRKESHATSVFVVLMCCVSSVILYSNNNQLDFDKAIPYAMFGLPGAFFGTYIISKINSNILRKLFSVFAIYAGLRILFW